MTCWAEGCTDDGQPRFVSKPVGSYSIAGAQPKVVATRYVLCDEHWELVQFNLGSTP